MPILDYLNKILTYQIQLKHPVISLLQPGLSEREILLKTSLIPIQIPREMINLYMWRNGTLAPESSTLGDMQFFYGYHLCSLEEALLSFQEGYSIWQKFYKMEFCSLFEDGAGGCCGVIPNQDSLVSPVIQITELGKNIIYSNLTKMMETIASCYENGVFWIGQNGYLDADLKKYGDIALRLNPEIEYWQKRVKGEI
ncbi:MAG: hypothetical protein HQM11_20415 [SAR324 cluster bacterium]|nr:hypothetical protein [SAR324 cluster bacterium]